MKFKDLFEEENMTDAWLIGRWLNKRLDAECYDDKPDMIPNVGVKDGVVTVFTDVGVELGGEDFPFKFADEHKYFLTVTDPKSFKNFPKKIGRNFGLYSKREMKFDGAPEHVGGSMILDIPSLEGIHKHVKHVEYRIALSPHVTKNVLGLLLIDGRPNFGTIMMNVASSKEEEDKINAVVDILNKYAGTGPKGVVRAQQDLIDADLDDYAGM